MSNIPYAEVLGRSPSLEGRSTTNHPKIIGASFEAPPP